MLNLISSTETERTFDSYSCSEVSRETAGKRYQAIAPLLKSLRLTRLRIVARTKKSRVKTIDLLAKQHGVSRRTIYNWLRNWNRGGLPMLMLKIRSDKGRRRSASAVARTEER